jgi:hypothetical protein
MRLSRCDDVLRPFTGGRPDVIVITNMMTKGSMTMLYGQRHNTIMSMVAIDTNILVAVSFKGL